MASLSVSELKEKNISQIADYWTNSDPEFMKGMGVDLSKLPSRDFWYQALNEQINQDYPDKKSYGTIWHLDGKAVGHCNVNKINFGEEAYMHLHLWNSKDRQSGMGSEFVKLSLPYFFRNLQLKKVYCEPFAHNISPNRTLSRVGFRFVKTYIGIPGFLNFEQQVNLWELDRSDFPIKE